MIKKRGFSIGRSGGGNF